MNNENIENELDNNELQEDINTEEIIENAENNGDDSANYFHEHDSLTENDIVSEVKKSFLDYSMSVITSRALPDLRDG